MSATPPETSWVPSFRRSLSYLGPHRRPLIIGLIAALGVSVTYTFSISAIVPLLKIIFAEHETLADWVYRAEAQRRLGVALAADLPDSPDGLPIAAVRDDSPGSADLRVGEHIVTIGAGRPPGSYALMRQIAEHAEETIGPVVVSSADGGRRSVQLALNPHRRWFSALTAVVRLLPAGRDSGSRLATLAIIMSGLVLISLLGGLCRLANQGLIATSVQRALHDLRSTLAEHVLRLPLSWHTTHPPGDVLGRFATDINKVETGQTTLFGKVIREPLKAAGVLTITLMIEWRLVVVALIALPVAAIVIRTFGKLVKRAQRRASQSWGRLLDHLGERLAGIRAVKAYNMQGAEARRFEAEGRRLTHAQTQIELLDAGIKPALETLATVAAAAFILYGANLVFTGRLDAHLFFAAVVCLGGIFDPVRKMGNVNNRLQAADVSAQRLFELLDLPAEPAARPDRDATLPRLERSIEFRDVSFAYPAQPDRVVLDSVSLTVKRGQAVALVGPNGSGKTTLVSLLLRFFEPTAGEIRIDGRNIASVNIESLRGQIGLVTQDAVIFSDTVRDNIAYGVNGVGEQSLRAAARHAHIDEFIQGLKVENNGELATGYDVPINARSLSGGQRQRLALARAILRDPPILILDEATSQVDSESERRIQEALDEVMRDRTTIIIAHRFSTIARADVIVVMSEGRIIATGKHADLLESCSFYASFCETQFAAVSEQRAGGER